MMSFPKRSKFRIYLDYAAATPLDVRVKRAMAPFMNTRFHNPSAMYEGGVAARNAIENARKRIAHFLGAQSDMIVFASGGTEANNLAVLGVAGRQLWQSKHIITTQIEHASVLEPIRKLEQEGWSVTYLPVNADGMVSVEDFKKALRKETMLVSIMYANNEIGSIQPIAEIGREILKYRKKIVKKVLSPRRGETERGLTRGNEYYPLFHTDACQAAPYLPLHVDALHVDLLTMNGSKIYGPKGIGVLYRRRGVVLEPLMYGGGQEFGIRSGTENIPGIVGLGKAVEMIEKGARSQEPGVKRRIRELRDYFWEQIQKKVADVVLNGPGIGGKVETPPFPSPTRGGIESTRLPNNLNVSFLGCDAEALIVYLDAAGIAVSSGSACSTESDESSHVLLACGYDDDRARSAIRFTLGRGTTKKEIEKVLWVLPKIVKIVRAMKK